MMQLTVMLSWRPFAGGGAGEGAVGLLGGVVADHAPVAEETGLRREVHRGALRLLEVREARLHVAERREEAGIDADHDVVDGLVLEVHAGDRRLGVVDQHVDASEGVDGLSAPRRRRRRPWCRRRRGRGAWRRRSCRTRARSASSVSWRMSVMVTAAPAFSSAVAIPLPMPRAAPVTIATLPSSSMPIVSPPLSADRSATQPSQERVAARRRPRRSRRRPTDASRGNDRAARRGHTVRTRAACPRVPRRRGATSPARGPRGRPPA